MSVEEFPSQIVAELVNTLGTDEFAGHLWKWIRSLIPVHHISCVRFHQSERLSSVTAVDLLFWRSVYSEEIFVRVYEDYSRKHWRHDPILRFLTDLNAGESILVHMQLPNPHAPNYEELLPDTAPTDECTLARRGSGGVICLTLYRHEDDAELSLAALSKLKQLSNLIMALIERHWRLTQGKVLSQIRPPDIATLFTNRLAIEGITLSEREAKSCIAFLEGTAIPKIAERLGVRASSVKTYLNRAYDKIGPRNRADLYQWSVSNTLHTGGAGA